MRVEHMRSAIARNQISAIMRKLTKHEQTLVSDIEKGVKNRWNWSWQDEVVKTVTGGRNIAIRLGDSIEKIDVPGKAKCSWCSLVLNYGSKGKSLLVRHLTTKDHLSHALTRATNQTLGSMIEKDQADDQPVFSDVVNSVPASSTDTDVTEANDDADAATAPSQCCPIPPKIIPLNDRVVHMEATILSVIAEQSWAFTAAPVLINLAKSLATDPEALDKLSMDRTSASIKIRYGLGPAFTARSVALMKKSPFSLNIDESTSTNSSRVLTVLVNVFDDSAGKIVMQHLASISLIRVDTQTVFTALVDLFEAHEIPWKNCVSILMDSCAVMRGSKNGLEKRLRDEKARHLLDIDGDACHHLHNATKKFCAPFGKWAEDIFMDLYNEFHWSSSNEDILKEMFFLLGEKYTTPHHFATHRWLSCLDAAWSCLHQFNPLTLYMFAFLDKSDRSIYQAIMEGICKGLSREARKRLDELQSQLRKKSATDDGKKRRVRLVAKFFSNRKWTRMVLGIYTSVLPILKEYMCLFQSSEPLIHQLFDKQVEVFTNFLGLFLQTDVFSSLKPKDLKSKDYLNITDTATHLPNSLLFTGKVAGTVLKTFHPSDKLASRFYVILRKSYVDCAEYLQKKLPLSSKLLLAMSVLDPETDFGHRRAQKAFTLEDLTNVIEEKDSDQYNLEVRKLGKEGNFPSYDKTVSVDMWWGQIVRVGKYPLVSRLATALLTCFHGPAVESSFNIMGEVIDGHSSRMSTDTYSAIQTVKYALRAGCKTSVESFRRKDKLHTPVNKNVCRLIRGANKKHREELAVKKKELERKRTELSLKKQAEISKQKAKAAMMEAEKRARQAHRKAMRSRLQALSRKRKREQKNAGQKEAQDSMQCKPAKAPRVR